VVNPAQAAAREALVRKLNELEAQEAAAKAAAPSPVVKPAPAPPSPPTAKPIVAKPKPVKPVLPQPKPTPAPVATTPAAVPGATLAVFPGKELGLKPIEAPPLPISAAKEAQLQALLAKYKADQITPEEYHKRRAEILAEP
jgi:hypothetical protein